MNTYLKNQVEICKRCVEMVSVSRTGGVSRTGETLYTATKQFLHVFSFEEIVNESPHYFYVNAITKKPVF